MRDLMTELKELRLHGMAGAWEELVSEQGTALSQVFLLREIQREFLLLYLWIGTPD